MLMTDVESSDYEPPRIEVRTAIDVSLIGFGGGSGEVAPSATFRPI
jgi:hypothetical protein